LAPDPGAAPRLNKKAVKIREIRAKTKKINKRMTKKETFKWTLQILASIISAVLTALGATSCMGC
jgi:hypothetical protein